MSGRHLSQSGYALQQILILVRQLLSQLHDVHMPYTYGVVFHFCEPENIDDLGFSYLNTSTPPCEEWAEEWLYEGDVKSSFALETGTGGHLILNPLV